MSMRDEQRMRLFGYEPRELIRPSRRVWVDEDPWDVWTTASSPSGPLRLGRARCTSAQAGTCGSLAPVTAPA